MEFLAYSEIQQYRSQQISTVSKNHDRLNQLHEEILEYVLQVAILNISKLHGPPPSLFSFFVMGSSGRREQSVWSDQDHGIIYEIQNNNTNIYFLNLGSEITKGLQQVGYTLCDGNVMASNPLWCKSLSEWERQLNHWLNESSWKSLRNLIIFMDSRSAYGENSFITQLKDFVYQKVHRDHLLKKILHNTLYHKKGISVLGQILVELHGPHSGCLNVKETAILPFVNAARLIAFKRNLHETSTLVRLDSLPESWIPSFSKDFYKQQFIKILHYRLWYGNHLNYETGHYLPIEQLTKEEKKQLKEAMKHGEALFHYVKRVIEKDDSFG